MPIPKSLAAFSAAWLAMAAPSASAVVKPRADLADLAQGRYSGDVISDARGSSQSDVRGLSERVTEGLLGKAAPAARDAPAGADPFGRAPPPQSAH